MIDKSKLRGIPINKIEEEIRGQIKKEMTFNLSEKIHPIILFEDHFQYLRKEDVAEFIRLLKEEIGDKCDCIRTDEHRKGQCWIFDEIDRLAGEKFQ